MSKVKEIRQFTANLMVSGEVDKNFILSNIINEYRSNVIPLLLEKIDLFHKHNLIFEIDINLIDLKNKLK